MHSNSAVKPLMVETGVRVYTGFLGVFLVTTRHLRKVLWLVCFSVTVNLFRFMKGLHRKVLDNFKLTLYHCYRALTLETPSVCGVFIVMSNQLLFLIRTLLSCGEEVNLLGLVRLTETGRGSGNGWMVQQ